MFQSNAIQFDCFYDYFCVMLTDAFEYSSLLKVLSLLLIIICKMICSNQLKIETTGNEYLSEFWAEAVVNNGIVGRMWHG